jgi:hypothetical protein
MKAAALLVALALPALADWKDEITPPKLGPHPRLAPQEFDYRLSWKGMLDAGALTFTFGKPDPKHPSDYTARASGGSTGLASRLFHYQVAMTSRLDPATLHPRHSVGVHDEGDEINTTRNIWAGTLVRTEQTLRLPESGKQATVHSELRFSPLHDVFSAMLQVRSHKLADGDRLVLPLLPSNKPYLLRVQVLAREKFAGRDTIKLDVALQKIDPKTWTLLPYKKMKRTTLWLSDDANRIPVELRAEAFIGDVRMTLAAARKL